MNLIINKQLELKPLEDIEVSICCQWIRMLMRLTLRQHELCIENYEKRIHQRCSGFAT
jgi:hypothetical protein